MVRDQLSIGGKGLTATISPQQGNESVINIAVLIS